MYFFSHQVFPSCLVLPSSPVSPRICLLSLSPPGPPDSAPSAPSAPADTHAEPADLYSAPLSPPHVQPPAQPQSGSSRSSLSAKPASQPQTPHRASCVLQYVLSSCADTVRAELWMEPVPGVYSCQTQRGAEKQVCLCALLYQGRMCHCVCVLCKTLNANVSLSSARHVA